MKRSADNLARKHIWVDTDDWQWYEETFAGRMKISEAIRLVMRKYRQSVEAKVGASAARPRADLEVGE